MLGALIGALVAGTWHAAETFRLDPRFPLEMIGRFLIAAVVSLAMVIAGSAAGFTWLQVRPVLLTVPAATVAGCVLVRYSMAALPGKREVQPWAGIVLLAADLALVALA